MPTPWVTGWGDDAWSWNVETDEDADLDAPASDGMPGRGLVGGAVALWGASVPSATVDDVARVFNLPPHLAEDVHPDRGMGPCDLGEAIQVWSLLNGGDSALDAACAVFGRPPREVVAAVEGHPWMYLESRGGALHVGHEGE